VIAFGDRRTNFTRPFRYDLGATVDPRIKLRYRVIRGDERAFNDEACAIDRGALVFSSRPTLSAACMIEVAAAAESADYVTPEPVRGLVEIGFALWDVRVPPVDTIRWSETNGTVTIRVNENSGDAFGIFVSQDDGGTECEYVSTRPESAPEGTTRYDVTLRLARPPADGYTCQLRASGLPQDYAGGNPDDEFTLTVQP
jgi:hypothetical protein